MLWTSQNHCLLQHPPPHGSGHREGEPDRRPASLHRDVRGEEASPAASSPFAGDVAGRQRHWIRQSMCCSPLVIRIKLTLLSSPSCFLPLLGLHAHLETRPLPDLGDPPLLTVGSKGLQLLLHVMPPGGVQPGHEPCQGASPQRHQQPRFEYHCTLHQGT